MSMNNDPTTTAAQNSREATKRLAQQGQWKTPPLPVFAAGGIVGPAAAAPEATTSALSTQAPIPLPTTLPATPDEYARMLQEAYKRGAEAAARAQKQSGDEDDLRASAAPAAAYSSPAPVAGAVASSSHAPHGQFVHHATAPTTAVPPGHPNAAAAAMHAKAANNYNFPTSSSAVPTAAAAVPPHTNYAAAPVRPQAVAPPPPSSMRNHINATVNTVHHSMSMPEISSYHHHQEASANANDEEEKRKKRLARNRASARLRRLKKKNLVDSYEGEVGILEAALSKLRSHKWSSDNNNNNNNHEALIEALSMERGQQPLTAESRRELIQSIVTQQKEQVSNLMECQMENWMLSCLADAMLHSPSDADGHGNANDDTTDEEMKELTTELQDILQLTPDQLTRIQQSSQGCIREIQDLCTVEECLDAILNNRWLLDEGVDEVASQFTSILNPSQLSKFLLWTDHNADAIEKLDYVNVGMGVENGPVFEFGVDEGMDGGE
ncbi:hypothetical protein HJC23_012568 [Cyclotella cryptica]|uniref:BZIP domain-containing protein n=1 Tax=Cyclotella cryptica TaxID=29204 RepID=A0ABD3NZ16_9STRA|eukprot:CCRYP_019042-RA/>CCRYP_019042-RA protein AED:0.02 eAED:0.02 QI:260/1/1/1/1/1/2/138/494